MRGDASVRNGMPCITALGSATQYVPRAVPCGTGWTLRGAWRHRLFNR
jgi:hypothetical protein